MFLLVILVMDREFFFRWGVLCRHSWHLLSSIIFGFLFLHLHYFSMPRYSCGSFHVLLSVLLPFFLVTLSSCHYRSLRPGHYRHGFALFAVVDWVLHRLQSVCRWTMRWQNGDRNLFWQFDSTVELGICLLPTKCESKRTRSCLPCTSYFHRRPESPSWVPPHNSQNKVSFNGEENFNEIYSYLKLCIYIVLNIVRYCNQRQVFACFGDSLNRFPNLFLDLFNQVSGGQFLPLHDNCVRRWFGCSLLPVCTCGTVTTKSCVCWTLFGELLLWNVLWEMYLTGTCVTCWILCLVSSGKSRISLFFVSFSVCRLVILPVVSFTASLPESVSSFGSHDFLVRMHVGLWFSLIFQ